MDLERLPDIRYWARRMEEAGVAPEMEIFELGMIPVALKFIAEDVIKPPYHFNFILGAHWAMPADPRSLYYLSSMLPENMSWGVVQDGMTDLSLMATAISLGASVVRVGFEDSVFYAPATAADTNILLVQKLVALIRQMGFEVASFQEAREILHIQSIA